MMNNTRGFLLLSNQLVSPIVISSSSVSSYLTWYNSFFFLINDVFPPCHNDRIFSILIEYSKYCCLVLLSCMSLRSIARSVSLRQLSLRSIPSSCLVNLDRVKGGIGQMDRHDGLRTKHTCRPRTKYLNTYVVRVDAHEWSCKNLAKRLCK